MLCYFGFDDSAVAVNFFIIVCHQGLKFLFNILFFFCKLLPISKFVLSTLIDFNVQLFYDPLITVFFLRQFLFID